MSLRYSNARSVMQQVIRAVRGQGLEYFERDSDALGQAICVRFPDSKYLLSVVTGLMVTDGSFCETALLRSEHPEAAFPTCDMAHDRSLHYDDIRRFKTCAAFQQHLARLRRRIADRASVAIQ